MKKLRIGVVGAGAIMRHRHFPGLLGRKDVEIVAVCNSTLESARRTAHEYNIPHVNANWADLIARRDLDIVWIGTPPNLHAPVAISALESGKHVFCQARMAMNLAEAREMQAVAHANPGLVNMLCPPPHGMKHGRFFKKLLLDGYVGEFFQFRLQALSSSWTDPSKPLHWRQNAQLSGLNMLTVGIYAEVLGNWLGQPRRIHAQLKIAISSQGGARVEVPDIVQVIGQWNGGLVGTLEWSGVALHAPGERLEVYGRDGTLVYDFQTDEIHAGRRGESGLQKLPVPSEFVQEWRVEEIFIEAVQQGARPEPGFDSGVKYMEFVEAVHRSARGGHALELPLP